MKVLILSHADNGGGAARAAFRLYQSLRLRDVSVQMWVDRSDGQDLSIKAPAGKLRQFVNYIKPSVAVELHRWLCGGHLKNPVLHSLAIVPTGAASRVNRSDFDLVNLHWINAEMISIRGIGAIRKPIVMTLHDMWAFCGAEHLNTSGEWKQGYRGEAAGSDRSRSINRWVWWRKRRLWTRPFQLVTPSSWLRECVQQSALMREWQVECIPNPIDTDFWRPMDQGSARLAFGLPKDVELVLFGSFKENDAPHKGADLLVQTLRALRESGRKIELVVFGQGRPRDPPSLGFKTHYVGQLRDDVSLKLLYSASDIVVVPSRIENFPTVAVEAHACGVPVAAFATCGLPDVIDHGVTGYLAKPFDSEELAQGIAWVLDNKLKMAGKARARAVSLWSYEIVAEQYANLYRKVLES
jgi:glycosyltransferase involved in cell wall biosynthesis